MNEFKVGDWVVAKRNFESNDLFKVERIGKNGGIYDEKWRLLLIGKLDTLQPKKSKQGEDCD